MDKLITLLTFFSGATIPGGLFIIIYLLFFRKENRLRINLLALLLFAVCIRCAKPCLYHSFGFPRTALAIGYFGLSNIGPLLWLYFKYLGKPRVNALSKIDCLHFGNSVFGVVCYIFNFFEGFYFYKYTSYLLLVYIAISWWYFLKRKNKVLGKQERWNYVVLGSLTVFGLIFVVQLHVEQFVIYVWGAALSSFLFYILLFFALKTPLFFSPMARKKKLNPQVVQKIERAIEIDKLYKNSSFTLDQFSKAINCPNHVISSTIKLEYEKTFTEFINQKRIEDVIALLTNTSKKQEKIEYLAYSVGFNTPSTFYAAFKKITGMSPTEYRKMNLKGS